MDSIQVPAYTDAFFESFDAFAVCEAEVRAAIASDEYAEWSARTVEQATAPDQPGSPDYSDESIPW